LKLKGTIAVLVVLGEGNSEEVAWGVLLVPGIEKAAAVVALKKPGADVAGAAPKPPKLKPVDAGAALKAGVGWLAGAGVPNPPNVAITALKAKAVTG
jgi:hypothetical protein